MRGTKGGDSKIPNVSRVSIRTSFPFFLVLFSPVPKSSSTSVGHPLAQHSAASHTQWEAQTKTQLGPLRVQTASHALYTQMLTSPNLPWGFSSAPVGVKYRRWVGKPKEGRWRFPRAVATCPSPLPLLPSVCFQRSFHPPELLSGIRRPHVPLGMDPIFSVVVESRGVWEGGKKERQEGEPQGEAEEWGGIVGGERNVFTLCHS